MRLPLTFLGLWGCRGYYTSSLGNADLGWEKTHSTDIAVDFGLFE